MQLDVSSADVPVESTPAPQLQKRSATTSSSDLTSSKRQSTVENSTPSSSTTSRKQCVVNKPDDDDFTSLQDIMEPPKEYVDTISPAKYSLKITSMNIIGCVPSKSANDWTRQHSEKAIRQEILNTDPDVIALQECQGGANWAKRVFPSYQFMGSVYSHMDQVMLLIKQGIKAEPVSVDVKDFPAVIAKMDLRDGKNRLLVASVHLAPNESGANQRFREVETLIDEACYHSLPMLIIGDTNMTVAEDSAMENHLKLEDVWKAAGSDIQTKFTWNTKDNRKENKGFNRFYGDGTREYTARYDRIYMYGNSFVKIENEGTTFDLIANKPVNGNNLHFLSDHFGMTSQIKIEWDECKRISLEEEKKKDSVYCFSTPERK